MSDSENKYRSHNEKDKLNRILVLKEVRVVSELDTYKY